jgi:DNA-directed RNA polymerase specialized sigma24 family protein
MIVPNLPASLPIAELPELARRMTAGDTRAREALFLSVARVAVREALRFGRDNRLDADDVVQEALLRLWQALPYYRAQLPDGRPAPPVPIVAAIWAGQHAQRFAMRERLRAARFPVAGCGGDDDDGPTRSHFDLIADDDAGADAVALADEVRTALAVLPPR